MRFLPVDEAERDATIGQSWCPVLILQAGDHPDWCRVFIICYNQ
jgi:hypothetical protein